MTAPTPAVVIRQAAIRLREAAEPAAKDLETDSFWRCYDPATAWRDGFLNGFSGPPAELVALFPPGAALALADWLWETADLHEQRAHRGESLEGCQWCADEDWPCADVRRAVAVARAVLGGGEDGS